MKPTDYINTIKQIFGNHDENKSKLLNLTGLTEYYNIYNDITTTMLSLLLFIQVSLEKF